MLQLSTNQVQFVKDFAAVTRKNGEIVHNQQVELSNLLIAVDKWFTFWFEPWVYEEPIVEKPQYHNPGWTIGDVVNRDEIYAKFSHQQ